MRRHPALVPLSRGHHDALLLAQELKNDHPGYARSAVPKALPQKLAYTQEFFRRELLPHFYAEERILIHRLRGRNSALDSAAETIIREHRHLAALAETLINADALDTFGRALEWHIRNEERVFFQLVQDVVPDAELAALAQELLDALSPQ